MTPEISLAIAQTCVVYLLKTSAAFGVCWLLCKLIQSPQRRFVVWLCFLIGSVLWWSSLALNLVPVFHDVATAAATPLTVLPANSSSSFTLLLPGRLVSVLGHLLNGLGLLYLLTCGYLFISALRNRLRLNWVLRFTYPPPSEVADLFAPLSEGIGFTGCRLRVLSGIASPATIGWWSPMILLPDFCTTLDRKKLSHILSHELHHIRRRDFFWDGIAGISRTLLFFHPAIHFAVRKMRLERELCCDLLVVGESPDVRADYAESLLSFARSSSHSNAWGIDFAAPVTQLKTRLRLILSDSKRLPAWLVTLRGMCGAALLLLLVIAMPLIAIVLHAEISQRSTAAKLDMAPISGLKHHRPTAKRRSISSGTMEGPATLPVLPESTTESLRTGPMPSELIAPIQEPLPRVTVADNSDDVDVEPRVSAPSSVPSAPPRVKAPAFPSWTSLLTDTARQIGSDAGREHGHDRD